MDFRVCNSCGLMTPAKERWCPRCGKSLEPTPEQRNRPRYTIFTDVDLVQSFEEEDLSDWLFGLDDEDDEDDEDYEHYERETDPFALSYDDDAEEKMGTGHYLATLLLFCIPVVGLILMIYWSLCENRWPERQKLATACMIKRLVGDLTLLMLALAVRSLMVGLSYLPMLIDMYGLAY